MSTTLILRKKVKKIKNKIVVTEENNLNTRFVYSIPGNETYDTWCVIGSCNDMFHGPATHYNLSYNI